MEDRIGSLIVVGLAGEAVSDAERSLIEEIRPAGVILFARNARPPGQLRELCDHITELAREPGRPPLILLDHEGGRVHRLTEPFTHFPSQRRLGAADDAGLTEAVFRAMAREIAAAGANVQVGPVLDLWTNPENAVIGDRAFGADPDHAARHGRAAARGIAAAGLLAVGKHFPGHGDTVADSHVELPTAHADRDTLERREFSPFRRLIEDGIPALMSAHILVPALDAHLPGTLSRPVVTGVLRNELGFDGLVMADDMEMGAVADHYGPGEAAVLAAGAGCDLLLYCHRPDRQRAAREALVKAVRSGRLPAEAVEQSVERIDKARRGLEGRPPTGPEVIGCDAHRELLDRVGGG